jgi:hypothetical protein
MPKVQGPGLPVAKERWPDESELNAIIGLCQSRSRAAVVGSDAQATIAWLCRYGLKLRQEKSGAYEIGVLRGSQQSAEEVERLSRQLETVTRVMEAMAHKAETPSRKTEGGAEPKVSG